MATASPFPIEVLAKVFPFLRDDPHAYHNLGLTNRQLHHISKALGGPRKWPDVLVHWEDNDNDIYVHQVKYSPNGRHVALLLRIYDNSQATDYHRVGRILDVDNNHPEQPLVELPVGRSTPFSGYCSHYFVAVEPRRVRVYDSRKHYRQVQEFPTRARIVGMQLYNVENPKIALQQTVDENNDTIQETNTLAIWTLGEFQYVRELPYTGSANFTISEDDRVFACVDGGEDGRLITIIYMDTEARNHRTYLVDLPGNPRRGWIDTCKFSPDSQRLAVLTEGFIFQLDVSTEPPRWMEDCQWRAPDRCNFSGQMQYTSDSQFLVAHARTPWNNVYNQDDNLNTVQIWNAETLRLKATKGFHDLVGSVGLSLDGKFVIVIQGDELDVFRSPIARIVTRYIAAMEDYSPYPESGEEFETGEYTVVA